MIRTLAAGPYGGRHRDGQVPADFLAGDAAAWLGRALTLRVAGWSMFPSLCRGDVLELAPPGDIAVADLVVFRRQGALVCHRVIALISGDSVRTRGDGVEGEGELVGRTDLVGKVARVRRGRRSFDPRGLPPASPLAPATRRLHEWRERLRGRASGALARAVTALGRIGLVRSVAGLIAERKVAFTLGIPAPLASVRAYSFVDLGRRPISRDVVAPSLPGSVSPGHEPILLARLGTRHLGTMNLATGDVHVGRIGTLLGLEGELRAAAAEL